MTKEMTVRECLEELRPHYHIVYEFSNEDKWDKYWDKKLDQALSQLKDLIKKKMPKRLEIPVNDDYEAGISLGRNIAISQMEEVIERVFK